MTGAGHEIGHEIHCFFSEKVMGHLRASVPARAAEVIVVRHGETSWNICGRFQGQEDTSLSDNGVLQAQAVAGRLGRGTKDVAVVYSSDLQRAVDTARPIADKCGILEVVTMASLRERHLGKLQGLTKAESVGLAPEALQASVSDNADEPIPGGGESLNELYRRTKVAMEDIAHKHFGQRVIVVTHGGVLRAMHFHSEGRVPATRVLNASVNVFHISASNEWTLRSWGDVNHLRGLEVLRSKAGGDELV